MTPLEKLEGWIRTYPGYDILSAFQADYTDQIPHNSGEAHPPGFLEVERRQDIMGHVTVTNQYNFGLYPISKKGYGDSTEPAEDTEWIKDFQEWAQEQSVTGRAPAFGDCPQDETITTQGGVASGTGDGIPKADMVQISVQYKKFYEENDKWLT